MYKKLTLTALTKGTSHSDSSVEGEARYLEEEYCNTTRSYLKCVPQYIPQRTKSHLPKDEYTVHNEYQIFKACLTRTKLPLILSIQNGDQVMKGVLAKSVSPCVQ